jgi:hypothetical protein
MPAPLRKALGPARLFAVRGPNVALVEAALERSVERRVGVELVANAMLESREEAGCPSSDPHG